ncbi:MAG: hypothetical protein JSV89_05255 [Spirochaetaceae bacterium]|nr:MAG: hypothetical protein JSV89_05255 [Spirochaetaceae bacterium]
MKAFLIIMVIFVILAGVAFYFGWIQIQLPPENYAVVSTKLRGLDDQVIRPGEFSWRWERLIPTFMTLYVFDLHPRTQEIQFRGSLPSAELYSSILPENPDFSYSGTVTVRFAIAPERLPALVAKEKLLPEELDGFYSAQADRISAHIQENLLEIEDVAADIQTLNRSLQRELASAVPDLQLLSVKVDALKLPDRDLYELARASYRDLVDIRDRSRDEAVASLAVERVRAENARAEEKASLEALREYGQLLNEYPILLKAMAVQKLSGEQVMSIPEFDLKSILE